MRAPVSAMVPADADGFIAVLGVELLLERRRRSY